MGPRLWTTRSLQLPRESATSRRCRTVEHLHQINTGGCVPRVVGWASWHGHSVCLTPKPDYIAALSLIKHASCPRERVGVTHNRRGVGVVVLRGHPLLTTGYGMGCPRRSLKTAPTIARFRSCLQVSLKPCSFIHHRPIANIILFLLPNAYPAHMAAQDRVNTREEGRKDRRSACKKGVVLQAGTGSTGVGPTF
jgi:hypothetical protein